MFERNKKSAFSEKVSEFEWVHELNMCLWSINNVSFSWLSGNSFCANVLVLSLGFSFLGIIFSHSPFESFSALTLSNMLNSNMESLGNDLSSNLFVNYNSNWMLSDIKDSSGLTMIILVGHSFVNTGISNNIDIISLSISCHNFWKRGCTILFESLLEKISSLWSISMSVWHL